MCVQLGSEKRSCKNRAVCVLVPAGRGEFSIKSFLCIFRDVFLQSNSFIFSIAYSHFHLVPHKCYDF